jgi:hypothetical protein
MQYSEKDLFYRALIARQNKKQHSMHDKISPSNAMKHFFYNSILCYLVSSLCSVARKFFHTGKRSRVAQHSEKRENYSPAGRRRRNLY